MLGERIMYVKNEMFYHFHKFLENDEISALWQAGRDINLTKKQTNRFNSYYDSYFPQVRISNRLYPIREAAKIIEDNKLYSTTEIAENIFKQYTKVIREMAIYMRETIFEEIRQMYFANLPSRKCCIWVLNEPSIRYWYNTLGPTRKLFRIKLTGVIHKADQRHLAAEILPSELIRRNAFEYWTGSDGTNTIEEELLFEGLINIVDEIDILEWLENK